MSQGWIKIHRQIQECDIWDNEEPFDYRSAWIDLLLLANHRDKETIFDGKPLTVGRGQRITSIRKLADRWNWSRDRVSRYLNLLEKLGMIERESDNRKTLLTIVNYEVFQGTADSNEDTHKDTHKATDMTLIRHKQERKNDKNEKNIKISFGEYHNVKLTQDEYDRIGNDYGPDKREQAIKYLDEYIEEKGYKSKSHNLAMRRWVFKALDEKKPKGNFMKTEISHNEIEDLYAN